MIRSLIREFLLQEEVFGAQAFVYHGSKAPPETMLPVFLEDKFTPGAGVGDMYGKGLYAVYDLPGSKTESGKTYGRYIYKLKVNLYGFISFDSDITRKIYKRDLSPSQQAELVGADEDIVEKLKQFDGKSAPQFSSDWADPASKYLRGKVKGLVYWGRNDGRCILLYDVSVAVPIAWKTVDDTSWTKVDRESIKSSLRRSSTGEWEKERYDISQVTLLKRLEKLPIEKRTIFGDLNLKGTSITSLPAGLQVGGNLNLAGASITSLPDGLKVWGYLNLRESNIASLPANLQVEGDLYLNNTSITSLPADIKVKGNIHLAGSFITSLPAGLEVGGNLNLDGSKVASLPNGLKVGGYLDLSNSKITSLSSDLHVGGDLYLSYTSITSLPAGLQVGGGLNLTGTEIASLPAGLKVGENLNLSGTPITSLPNDLQVGGYLDLSYTSITSLPAGLQVGGGLNLTGTEIASLPDDLQVGGYLYLKDTLITSVPASVKVGGKIYGLR